MTALSYHPSTPRKLIEEDLGLIGVPNPAVYQAQLESILSWECFGRLPEIEVPTLLIHGDADQRIPYDNSPLIASQIPNAKVVSLPNTGHVFFTEKPAATFEAVLDFLLK
jgi:pimeloyl-ACP methyl ester carboxylesterase